MGRRSVLALVAAISVVSAGLGWLAGQRIRSPAEVAAAAEAPEPSLITVPVEERELSSRVVLRGTVVSAGSTEIFVSGSVLGAGLLTRLPVAAGDQLEEGQVAVEVAGRPVFVLQGDLPEFRSLSPGMDGPDVKQLELALARLGYNPGTIDDEYTVDTGTAVAKLYQDAGYRANEPTREELALIESAEDRVDQASDAVDAATAGTTSSGLPDSQLLQLDWAITQASDAVADAEAARTAELEAAAATVAEATTALAEAEAALAALPGPGSDNPASDEDRAAATAAVDAARLALTEAEAGLAEATTRHDRFVRDAQTQLEIAQSSKAEAIAAASGSAGGGSAGPSLSDLKADLADAREDLADLRASIGVAFPAAEFRFVRTLPSLVQSVHAEVGDTPSGSVMTVSGSSTLLDSSVADGDHKLLELGLEGLAEDDDLGISVPVVVTELATEPGGINASADRYALVLTPTEDVPEEAMFQSLRVTIPISSTGGEVLAVPLAALSAGADGSSRVEVDRGGGATELVPVNTGLSADGYVEVSPLGSASLGPGDRVVVGRDLLLPGETPDGGDDDTDDDTDDDDGGG